MKIILQKEREREHIVLEAFSDIKCFGIWKLKKKNSLQQRILNRYLVTLTANFTHNRHFTTNLNCRVEELIFTHPARVMLSKSLIGLAFWSSWKIDLYDALIFNARQSSLNNGSICFYIEIFEVDKHFAETFS